MKLHERIWVKDDCLLINGDRIGSEYVVNRNGFGGEEIEKVEPEENVIVLTIEELLDVYNNGSDRMEEIMNNISAGCPEKEPSIPNIVKYLKSKGVDIP